MKIGFLINPIAGMGGRVGLKGTDGVFHEALDRGAVPIAHERAKEAIDRYKKLISIHIQNHCADNTEACGDIEWLTCADNMGYHVLHAAGLDELCKNSIKVVYEPQVQGFPKTSAEDTKMACRQFLVDGVDLVLFCGGDGTARDVYSVVHDNVLMFGIPSGVKMHSGVFAIHAGAVGDVLVEYLNGDLEAADGEILDLDEDRYRAGEWNIRLFGVAKTLHEPTRIQCGKQMVETVSEDEIKEDIADFIEEEMEENQDLMYILGSGSTVMAVEKHLGIDGTLLGIDAVYEHELIGKDLNENELLDLLREHPKAHLILSPIGAQGFILGRGNLQLSPNVIKQIGLDNIVVISTPAKLADIKVLRVDTNDREVDNMFYDKGWFMVKVGYRQMKLKKISV